MQAWYDWHTPTHARLTDSDLDSKSFSSDDARRGEDSANEDSGAKSILCVGAQRVTDARTTVFVQHVEVWCMYSMLCPVLAMTAVLCAESGNADPEVPQGRPHKKQRTMSAFRMLLPLTGQERWDKGEHCV